MKYTPTSFDSSNNVSARHPLREFLQYFAGIGLAMIAFYYLIGLAVDFSVDRISPKNEQWLWGKLQVSGIVPEAGKGHAFEQAQTYVQQLVDRVPPETLSVPGPYQVRVIEEETINAFAYPGGVIILTSGLLKNIPSENALMFVLGHELGHFMARDQIRQLGRGLVVLGVSALTFGEDASVNNTIANMFLPIRNKFSQRQELDADVWGIKVLNSVYGHVGGATDFFSIILKERSESRFLDAFTTHPLSSDRTERIHRLSKQDNLAIREARPIPRFF